jgi:transposase-like protein
MNSKELLEQATAKVEKINDLSSNVINAESVLAVIGDGKVCFFTIGIGTTHLTSVLTPEKLEKLREEAVREIIYTRDEKAAELENLLGIRKPTRLNPEFEKEVQEMEQSSKSTTGTISENKDVSGTIESDPAMEKLTGILQKEAEKTEAPHEDKSSEKYPAPKTDKRRKYPENMTEEVVGRMYRDEEKSMAQIAEHFGVKSSTVNNFIYLHGLKRTSKKQPEKQPEETERPSQA